MGFRHVGSSKDTTKTEIPVLPIPLHDLESIYWVLVWMLLTRTKTEEAIQHARDIFLNSCSTISGRSKLSSFFGSISLISSFPIDSIYRKLGQSLRDSGDELIASLVKYNVHYDASITVTPIQLYRYWSKFAGSLLGLLDECSVCEHDLTAHKSFSAPDPSSRQIAASASTEQPLLTLGAAFATSGSSSSRFPLPKRTRNSRDENTGGHSKRKNKKPQRT